MKNFYIPKRYREIRIKTSNVTKPMEVKFFPEVKPREVGHSLRRAKRG
jgi:hypothetical protein